MNVEFIPKARLDTAMVTMGKGGAFTLEAIAEILVAKAEHANDTTVEGYINCSSILNKSLKKLQDDPYLALGLTAKSEEISESDIKKAYRKLALKFHPDKTQNKTGLLFTVIQGAYTLLSDEDKRKAHDLRQSRVREKLERMRAQKEAEKARKREQSRNSTHQSPPTNSFRMPPTCKEEAQYREFNRRFYDDFRKKSKPRPPPSGAPPSYKSPRQSTQSSGGTTGSSSSSSRGESQPRAPPRPVNLRATSRTDSTVTLQWSASHDHHHGHDKGSTAYELQWRERNGAQAQEWETSAQLILSTTCRKKNLKAGTCYEFRVRAASAWGWSAYGDTIMVVTANSKDRERRSTTAAASSEQQQATKAPPKRDLYHQKGHTTAQQRPSTQAAEERGSVAESWNCVVCGRPNDGPAAVCTVCFTKRSYKGSKLKNISKMEQARAQTGYKGTQRPSMADESDHRPQTARVHSMTKDQFPKAEERGCNTARKDGSDDEEDSLNHEETWEFSESDVATAEKEMERRDKAREVRGAAIAKEMTALAALKLGEVKRRLEAFGVSSTGFLEKADFVRALAEYNIDHAGATPDTPAQGQTRTAERAQQGSAPQPQPSARPSVRPSSPSDEPTNGNHRRNTMADSHVFPRIYWLNTEATRLHNVRAEPIKASNIVGHLLADRQVLALAQAGDWLKVEWHRAYKSGESQVMTEGCGWCLATQNGVKFLNEDVAGGVAGDVTDDETGYETAPPSSSEQEEVEELIYELRDDAGDLYYFNSVTGVSSWEPPEWVDSIDPVSGALYYENTITGETQWELPFDFIPVVREEAYSTPEAQFIKSVLSPKRSRGARAFYSPYDT